MRVWNNTLASKDLIEVLAYSRDIFIHQLTANFENKFYGKSVEEIFYIEVCEIPLYTPMPEENIFYYGKTKKLIQLGFGMDYNIAIKQDGKSFCRYLANKYLERSLDIEDLKIPDFNLDAYISDLESFFQSHNLI